MVNVAHLIPLFPFLAFLINIAFGGKLKNACGPVSVAASAISFVLALFVYQGFRSGGGSYSLGTWLSLGDTPLNFGVMVDGLSIMMLLVVTFIGTLIQIYSIGYMQGDPRFSRYFAYISLFMASMLGLVIADNFVMLYIFWEGVGLCSYLLISFWFEKPAAARAGLKAFVTTRIGDTGLFLGILLLFFTTKTLSFHDLQQISEGHGTVLAIVAVLVFIGAAGKSAQFPLHVWLPDAMEGPTPVSALIHAATMVAAGVYLVARTYPLFLVDPFALQTVAVIGGISALLAASIATVNNDIKRVLAYSTVSQLGLMMLGLGVGGYAAGTFHLMTHAFFKALLFLCAGSVIHAVHTQDIWKMGGLFSKMRVTATTFLIGTLAIAGVPPLAGFWSKDEILSAAYQNGHTVLFGVAVLTSFLTAFYMSRLIFVVLFGKPRSNLHPHESPATMTVPLMILAVFAALVGFVGSPLAHHAFQGFVGGGESSAASQANGGMMILSTVISLAGIGLAYLIYILNVNVLPAGMLSRLNGLHQLLLNKYYIDEIYDAFLVQPFLGLCRISYKIDLGVVDDLVNGVARFVAALSEFLRPMQTGLVQNYLLVQIVGLIILILTLGKLCFRY